MAICFYISTKSTKCRNSYPVLLYFSVHLFKVGLYRVNDEPSKKYFPSTPNEFRFSDEKTRVFFQTLVQSYNVQCNYSSNGPLWIEAHFLLVIVVTGVSGPLCLDLFMPVGLIIMYPKWGAPIYQPPHDNR